MIKDPNKQEMEVKKSRKRRNQRTQMLSNVGLHHQRAGVPSIEPDAIKKAIMYKV